MRKDVENLFKLAATPLPPDDLADRIIGRIAVERRRATLLRRIAFFSVGAVASMSAFVPAVLALRTAVAESGFAQYLSLLFSDGGAVAAAWQDFAYALMESLPAAASAACLSALMLLIASLTFLSRDVRSLRRD